MAVVRCISCGYDLSGQTAVYRAGERCPECGEGDAARRPVVERDSLAPWAVVFGWGAVACDVLLMPAMRSAPPGWIAAVVLAAPMAVSGGLFLRAWRFGGPTCRLWAEASGVLWVIWAVVVIRTVA